MLNLREYAAGAETGLLGVRPLVPGATADPQVELTDGPLPSARAEQPLPDEFWLRVRVPREACRCVDIETLTISISVGDGVLTVGVPPLSWCLLLASSPSRVVPRPVPFLRRVGGRHACEQRVEATLVAFPDLPVLLEPRRGLSERGDLEPAGPALPGAAARDQSGSLEHPEVLEIAG